jgi:tRNA threonylcarbamoyladenosine biosynthesis protein TsaB
MNEEKPLLSIETSESLCGACVYYSDKKYFEVKINLKYSHAEKLFDLINFVLNSAGIETKQLSAIAVSSGPGSFTGLRIGMSAAKGMAVGAMLPIIPVPTFEAMALQLSDYLHENSNVIIANKVNVEEIYFAKFQIKSNNYIFVENLKIVKHPEFEKELSSGKSLVFGNAVKIFDSVQSKIDNFSAPDARYVAKWGRIFGDNLTASDFDYLEPNYLKNFIVKERKNV